MILMKSLVDNKNNNLAKANNMIDDTGLGCIRPTADAPLEVWVINYRTFISFVGAPGT